MKKHHIDLNEYANDILKALPKGILLTTKVGSKINSMVIGWGTFGVNWSKPVFVTYVREGRFTREQLDANPEFTVNVPTGDFDRKIIAVCGGKSGRNMDKIQEAGLTPVDAEKVTVPAIKEFPLTLECKVIYRQKQDLDALHCDRKAEMYPPHVDGTAVGANRDVHVTYYGEIVAAYILDD